MAYITKEDVRDHSDTENLGLTGDARLTDAVLTALIFSSSQWINNQLNADKAKNENNQYVYINYQSDDENADSYCNADQLSQIEQIVLYDVVAKALIIHKDSGTTPKFLQIDPMRPVWADDEFDSVRKAKSYRNAVKEMITALIAEDAQYRHFGYAKPDSDESYGFIKVNQDYPRKTWTQKTVWDIANEIP